MEKTYVTRVNACCTQERFYNIEGRIQEGWRSNPDITHGSRNKHTLRIIDLHSAG